MQRTRDYRRKREFLCRLNKQKMQKWLQPHHNGRNLCKNKYKIYIDEETDIETYNTYDAKS